MWLCHISPILVQHEPILLTVKTGHLPSRWASSLLLLLLLAGFCFCFLGLFFSIWKSKKPVSMFRIYFQFFTILGSYKLTSSPFVEWVYVFLWRGGLKLWVDFEFYMSIFRESYLILHHCGLISINHLQETSELRFTHYLKLKNFKLHWHRLTANNSILSVMAVSTVVFLPYLNILLHLTLLIYQKVKW